MNCLHPQIGLFVGYNYQYYVPDGMLACVFCLLKHPAICLPKYLITINSTKRTIKMTSKTPMIVPTATMMVLLLLPVATVSSVDDCCGEMVADIIDEVSCLVTVCAVTSVGIKDGSCLVDVSVVESVGIEDISCLVVA